MKYFIDYLDGENNKLLSDILETPNMREAKKLAKQQAKNIAGCTKQHCVNLDLCKGKPFAWLMHSDCKQQ